MNGVPRRICFDPARCQVEKQTNSLNENKIEIIEAPESNHRALGLVKMLTQTSKRSLGCIKEAAKPRFESSVYTKLYQLQNCLENLVQSECILAVNQKLR